MANPQIHPSAIIDEGCHIGDDTRIWHFCHLVSGCHVGSRCSLGQNVVVLPTARIGDGCRIQNNVSIYDGVTLEDDVFVGPSAVFTNVINPRAFISRKKEYRPTLLCRGASIGANVTVVCGVTIGEYALVGAGSVVTRDVPAFALMTGNPARQRGWVSRNGEKLTFDADGYSRPSGSDEIYFLDGKTVTIIKDNANKI